MMEDDNGPLAQSAGAKILRVYDDAPNSSQSQFDTWWNTQQQIAIDGKMVLVVVDSKSSKCRPFNTWLQKRNDVRFTSAKHLAQAITGNNGEGDLLLDAKKEVIEKMEGWDDTVEEVAKVAAKTAESMETSEAVDESKAAAKEKGEKEEKEEVAPKQNKAKQQAEAPVHAGEKRSKKNELAAQEEEATDKEKSEDQPPDKKRRRKEQPKELTKEKENEMETETVEQSREEHSFDANMDDAQQSDEDEPGLPDERIPLPTTTDGWLVAAPKSRKAYRKAIEETEAEKPTVAAQTQKVSGLIVRQYVKPVTNTRPNGRTIRKGKDFKRFRKNHIIRGFSSSESRYADYRNANGHDATVPSIRLISVLPKESERQRQLEQQQQELEREQEIADSLFNDTGGGGGKRGRKSGNNSMYQYLSQQTTTKKGRGRR
jgi:hypothetical protein